MTKLPRIALIAAIVAFVTVAAVIVMVLNGLVIVAPVAVIPLCAGLGIIRRRVWSAYGYALCTAAQLLLMPLLLRRASHPADVTELIGTALLGALDAALFFFAGRALERTGAQQRGSPVPWIVTAVVITLPLIFIQTFSIPTGAMEDTLLVGDRILVPVFPRAKPVRGEMVVLHYPVDRRQTYIKRIIGAPGDRIRISHKVVYRNGAPLSEPWVVHKTTYEDEYRDNFPGAPSVPLAPQAQEMLARNVVNRELVVPTGKYFVMGDNRDSSWDSRYWGFISETDMIGKPLLIYDSVEQTSEQAMKSQDVFRRRTRWNRLFKKL